MPRAKTTTVTPRTSTRSSNRRLANLLSSDADGTPVMKVAKQQSHASPMMLRADETMLYDIAPPPDMPSSSLFGDESDEDLNASPGRTKGNAVKGKGNLLTPVNSELITSSRSQPSARQSIRLPSPESLPQVEDASSLNGSQSWRRPPRSDTKGTPLLRLPNGVAATPTTSQRPEATSTSSRKADTTPNHVSRHATPPRPLVAETAYFRRTLTPIARKALKGKAVGCMEKPIDFEGEDPLLLEPELRHRSGSLTPGSIARSKRIPRTAPTGKSSRTKLKAPPATSAAQRLFVRPDVGESVASPKSPDDISDDEAGDDTFVDVKKRRQPKQRSALGSNPPLNASDLKSSDPADEANDITPRGKSPLLDLGRFVRQASPNGTTNGMRRSVEDEDLDPGWDEPLFLPGSPDSSIGSPPPRRDLSTGPVDPSDGSASSSRSQTPVDVPTRPSSSSPVPVQPSPVVSLRSSPVFHAPTPTLGVPSPIRPPLSSPAVHPSPVFTGSPALRAPTPGNTHPSPEKSNDSLRKRVQTKSRTSKRLSESVRSPSGEIPASLREPSSQRSSSRLQSPFQDSPHADPPKAPVPLKAMAKQVESPAVSEEDFSLEGDTLIVADEAQFLELEEDQRDAPEDDVETVPDLSNPPAEKLAPVDDDVHLRIPERRASLSQRSLDRIVENAGLYEQQRELDRRRGDSETGVHAGTSNSDVVAERSTPGERIAGSQRASRASERRSSRQLQDGITESRTQAKSTASIPRSREASAEDPMLLGPAPSAIKARAPNTRQSWLNRIDESSTAPASALGQKSVRVRSSTPASPLGQRRSNRYVSAPDNIQARSPVSEQRARPTPSPLPKTIRAELPQASPRRSELSLSPSVARGKESGDNQLSQQQKIRPPHPDPEQEFLEPDEGVEHTVDMPDLGSHKVEGSHSPQAVDAFSDFLPGAAFSDDDDDAGADGNEEHETEGVRPTEYAQEASFDLSAETVSNLEEHSTTGFPSAARHEYEADARAEDTDDPDSDRREASNTSSRSPYVPDDSPLADVVNAAIEAGMVLEASSTAGDGAEDSHPPSRAETPARPEVRDTESPTDVESDEDTVMPPRLRRSLHAGATPRRPNIPPAKVAPSKPRSPQSSSKSRVSDVVDDTPESEKEASSRVRVRPASSAPTSSPAFRDPSSPFMARRSVNAAEVTAVQQDEMSVTPVRDTPTLPAGPEIVVEPSSPPIPHRASTSEVASPGGDIPHQRTPLRARRSTMRTPGATGTAPSSATLHQPTPIVSADRSGTLDRQVHAITPRSARGTGKTSATPAQEQIPTQRTDATPLGAPSSRVIKPLPTRGARSASVTPTPHLPPDAVLSLSGPPSRSSSRATSRSRSPYRNYSPKAIGTATIIAATALSAAVPAAASPSPATIRSQLSPEPEVPYLASAVSHSHSPKYQLHAHSYRSPARSIQSSRLSATPTAHSTQSERSRSSYALPNSTEHISVANSRLALALAGLSDDEDDDLPSPPKISFTPLFRRSHEQTPSADPPAYSPSGSVSRKRALSQSSAANITSRATPKSAAKEPATSVGASVGTAVGSGEPSEGVEDRDIGADDTVVLDNNANDSMDAGSAWDLTAAEFTFDAEMTAFNAHAFKGADWDVTRIERVHRGRSAEHHLQDIDEQPEEESPESANRTPARKASATESTEAAPLRPVTPPNLSPALSSPVRRSPRLSARRRASAQSQGLSPEDAPLKGRAAAGSRKTPTPVSTSPVRSSPRLAVKRQGTQPESPLRSAARRIEDKSTNKQAEMGDPEHNVDSSEAERDYATQQEAGGRADREEGIKDLQTLHEDVEPKAVPSHKVTLKVVTRVVKLERGSEAETDPEVEDVPHPEEDSAEGQALPSENAHSAAPEEESVAVPSAPTPPPPPTPPKAPALPAQPTPKVATNHPTSVADHVIRPTAVPTRLPQRSDSTGAQRTSNPSVREMASRIPQLSTGRHAGTGIHTPAADERNRTPAQPASRPQASFVREQSKEIGRVLGSRPVIPSKLSKEVAPSSSPAGSPDPNDPSVEFASVTRHTSSSRPTAALAQSHRSPLPSSSSSSRLKRRIEESPDDDDDAERYAPRASLHEELTAASDSDSEFDPEFPSMVAVSSVDPRAAARAAAILKMHHNWIENGILPDGSRVGTPRPQERSRARSFGALETPRSTGNRSTHATPHSRFFDSIENSRLISKEELLHEAEMELVERKSRPGTPFAADSPMRHIPGAWAATPNGRTPKRKRALDDQAEDPHQDSQHPILDTPFELQSRYNSSSYEGDEGGRPWTKRDWRYLEKTFLLLKAKASGSTPNPDAVVSAFLKQTSKEPVGEWSRDVLRLRVNVLAKRGEKEEPQATEREVKRLKTGVQDPAPPSTLRKVMGWLWPSNSKQQAPASSSTAAASGAQPEREKRDGNFMRVRDESFDIGEVTMAATPSRPREQQDLGVESSPLEDAHYAERSFEVDLERGHQTYDIPYDEEDDDDDEEEYFREPVTYTARGERSSVTEASTSMNDYNTSTSSTRKIYPDLPNLHFPSRPHSLASSTRQGRNEEPRRPGSRLPVMGTPRPRARVRSDSSIADTSIASRPGSVRDMVRGFEESQELDLSFESARREREKDELLGLRRVRSVVEKVKEQYQL